MPSLNVRDVPPRLHRSLRRLAKSRRRTLRAEVITLLDGAVQSEESRRQQEAILRRIERRRMRQPLGPPFVVEALREDRSR